MLTLKEKLLKVNRFSYTESKGFYNVYLGKDIVKYGDNFLSDCIASGLLVKMNCRTSEGLTLYKERI
jgi:hypothetical protein